MTEAKAVETCTMAEAPLAVRETAPEPSADSPAPGHDSAAIVPPSFWKVSQEMFEIMPELYSALQARDDLGLSLADLERLETLLNQHDIGLDVAISLASDTEMTYAYIAVFSRPTGSDPVACELIGLIPILDDHEPIFEKFWTLLPALLKITRPAVNIICANFKEIVTSILYASQLTPVGSSLAEQLTRAPAFAVADVLVAAWLLEPDRSPTVELLNRFLPQWRSEGKEARFSETPTKKKKKNQSPDHLQLLEELLDIVLIAHELFGSQLFATKLDAPYWDQEGKIPLLLGLMEYAGIGFESSVLSLYEETLRERLEELQGEADSSCGFEVGISSPKKLQDVLYKKLRLQPETQKSASLSGGGMSTSESVLKSMRSKHPLPSIVLEFRQVQKVLTAFVEPLQRFGVDGIIRTSWSQIGIATGRLSSSTPNLQALPSGDTPIKTSAGDPLNVNVRLAFKARTEGWVLVGADYSGLEMRLSAHFAQDESLIAFFNSGKDIHSSVAAHWLKKDVGAVTKTERENSKKLVYGIMYGIGPRSLAGSPTNRSLSLSTHPFSCRHARNNYGGGEVIHLHIFVFLSCDKRVYSVDSPKGEARRWYPHSVWALAESQGLH